MCSTAERHTGIVSEIHTACGINLNCRSDEIKTNVLMKSIKDGLMRGESKTPRINVSAMPTNIYPRHRRSLICEADFIALAISSRVSVIYSAIGRFNKKRVPERHFVKKLSLSGLFNYSKI